ncbi:MAG TPA: hypothetical protein VI837_05230 [Blastocatellia bacterium]|nr:hypothetical protein [Blastocatellia bacterium]
MSRLDDELRRAFRREQPPADFTARLLERVAQQPAPKAPWWHRLAMLPDPPKLRWVAIGVTASLLLAIGAAQYSRLNQVVVDDGGKIAKNEPAPEPGSTGSVTADKDHAPQDVANTTEKPAQNIKPAAPSSTNHRLAQARHRESRELRAEGEAAKEKLMLALSIASSALSDAQKAVHTDGLKP